MEKKDSLREVMLENEARSVRKTKLDVIEIRSQIGSPGLGMMIAIVAKKETRVLSHLQALFGEGPAGAEEARQILSKKPIRPITATRELVHMLVREPVYADVQYGGQALHKGIFVPPGMEAVSTIFPYMISRRISPVTIATQQRRAERVFARCASSVAADGQRPFAQRLL